MTSPRDMPQAEVDLPVAGALDALMAALREHGSVVLEAPPGSGKTTLVPPAMLAEEWPGEIVLLQPRRVATRAVARLLARRHGCKVGETVGYQVRFEKRVSSSTRLRVVTEGILTAWLERDPELTGVSAVVLDEFHERSLQADLALALLREVQSALRPDLKLVVMSATLDAAPVAAYLDGCPILRCEGRQYPLEITYATRQGGRSTAGQVTQAVVAMARAMDDGQTPMGHILAFVPGVREIDATLRGLAERGVGRVALPLHGRLDARQQDRALERSERPRIIVSTNIAETSLTIEGVTGVVDSGLVRLSRHDPGLGVARLETRMTSRASAAQRAGRAGRLGPGRAHRLWTEHEHRSRAEFDDPEIRRVDLAPLILALRGWGVTRYSDFEFFEAPDSAALDAAESLLRDLGALDAQGAMTAIGRELQRLGTSPRIGRALIAARERGVLDQALWLAAVLSEGRGAGSKGVGAADALAVLYELQGQREVKGARQIERLAHQLGRNFGVPPSPLGGSFDEDALCEALFWGWPDRICRRLSPGGSELIMVGGRGARLHDKCVVQTDEFLLGLDVDAGARGERSRCLVRSAARVAPEWLEKHPDVSEVDSVRWDASRQRVVALRERRYRDLVLSARPIPLQDKVAASRCLAEAVAREPERALKPDTQARQTISRLRLVAGKMPDADLPHDPWAWLLERLPTICHGLTSYEALRRLNLSKVLLDQLPWSSRQLLERAAPTHVDVPSGRRAALTYPDDGAPVLAIKVQEVFGWSETPMVCGGRQPIVLHLLDPAGRPLQVTGDLESFWERTWVQVRKEMRSRYPKHRWPEDPKHAEASQRTTKRRR